MKSVEIKLFVVILDLCYSMPYCKYYSCDPSDHHVALIDRFLKGIYY